MTHPLSPTKVLPALAALHACNAAGVGEALRTLRDVYFPHAHLSMPLDAVPALKQSLSETVSALRPKRMARIVHHDDIPDSGYASAEEDDQEEPKDGARGIRGEGSMDEQGMEGENDEEELNLLRSDELQRGYAIKWLTGLVKRGDAWALGSEEQEARMAHLEDASGLLARFASNDTEEEALTRTFVFPFRMPPCLHCCFGDVSSPAPPIMVELNDAPVDGTDHTAVGLQSWGSAIVFAERMCSNPERYLGALHDCTPMEDTRTKTPARPRRLLELGAGTGLLSITTSLIFSRMSIPVKIKATDYHLSVLENLARNVRDNHSPSTAGVFVSVEKIDWCVVAGAERACFDANAENEDGGMDAYDVVLAADVVYYPEHASWIRGCVERMMKKDGVFWLIIPVRTTGRHERLGDTVEEAFPFVDGKNEGLEGEGKRLAIVHREEVERVDGVGRADEGGYRLFEIRWV